MVNKTNTTKINEGLKPTEELKKLIDKGIITYFEVIYKALYSVNRTLGSDYAKLVRETLIEKGVKKSHINTIANLSKKLSELTPKEFALNDFSLVKFMKQIDELSEEYGIDWQDFLELKEIKEIRNSLKVEENKSTGLAKAKRQTKKKPDTVQESLELPDTPSKGITPNYHKGLVAGSPFLKEAFTLLITQDTLSEEFGRNKFDWELEEVILNRYSEELNLRQLEYLLQKIVEEGGYGLLPKVFSVPEFDKVQAKISKIFSKVNNVGILKSKEFTGLFYTLLFRVYQFVKESINADEEAGLEVIDMVVFENMFNIALERDYTSLKNEEQSLLYEFTKDMNEELIPAFIDQIRSDVHNLCSVKGLKSALSLKATEEFMLHLVGGFNWVMYVFHNMGIVSESLFEDVLATQNIVSYNNRRVVKIINEISRVFK